jgi:hypothetical protein
MAIQFFPILIVTFTCLHLLRVVCPFIFWSLCFLDLRVFIISLTRFFFHFIFYNCPPQLLKDFVLRMTYKWRSLLWIIFETYFVGSLIYLWSLAILATIFTWSQPYNFHLSLTRKKHFKWAWYSFIKLVFPLSLLNITLAGKSLNFWQILI